MKTKLLLTAIIMLAFILRFWNLGNYPALNADEAAIGYNAYSLLETGKDEHGNPWPIHFQSFNDYKPGLYVYIVIPFVKLLGLNEWSVRVPNALLGVATVYLVYLLVSELFRHKVTKSTRKNLLFNIGHLALIASFMLAISPWHLHFSRGGWEVNTSTFFMSLGTLLFLKAVNSKQSVYLFASSTVFVLSLYTYHSARVIVPLLALGLVGIYFKELKSKVKTVLVAGIFAIFLLLPLAKDMLQPEISSRASGVGLLADAGPLNRINELRGEHSHYNAAFVKMTHNKFVNYGLSFLNNWSDHYHGLFLFISGDEIQRNKVPETGQMYLIDAILVAVGILWIAKNVGKSTRLILHWLVIAPVAAALTFQSPHALRAQNMVIPLIILSAIGFVCIWDWFSSKGKYLLIIGHWSLVVLIALSFLRYLHMYYTHMSKEYPYSSQYGVKELVTYLESSSKNQEILVTTKYDQPYILFLFFEKYSPLVFQGNHELTRRDQFGFSTVPGYGKYIFKNIDLESDKIDYPDNIIVGTPQEIPDKENVVKRIYGTNEFEYFRVIEN